MPLEVRRIAKGITREQYPGYVAYVFDNEGGAEGEGMGAFLLNAEDPSPGSGCRVNLGLDFSTDEAKIESAKMPPGGWTPTPEHKTMSTRLERIYLSCRIMRSGRVESIRCTECEAKGKRGERECKKLSGLTKRCLWCTHLGRKCRKPGEDDEDDDGGNDGDGGEADDGKRKGRKVARRKSSRQKSTGEGKATEVAGNRTLAGRVEKPDSKANRPGGSFDAPKFQNPWVDEDDCAVESDASALIHSAPPRRSSQASKPAINPEPVSTHQLADKNNRRSMGNDRGADSSSDDMPSQPPSKYTIYGGPAMSYTDKKVRTNSKYAISADQAMSLKPARKNSIVAYIEMKEEGGRSGMITDKAGDVSPEDDEIKDSLGSLKLEYGS